MNNDFVKKIKNKLIIKYFFVSFIFFLILSKSFSIVYIYLNNKKSDFVNIIERECESKYMYVGPFLPHYYFKFKKINPTYFDVLFTNHNTKDQFELAKDQIIEKNPDCGIFYLGGNFEKFNYDKNNCVYQYFEDNYDLIYNKDNMLLYKKYE